MAHGARKHALQNYVYVRSLQKYLQLYYDLIGRQSLVSQEMPTPEIDASVPVPAKVGATADSKKPLVTMTELARSGFAGNEGHGVGRGAAEVARRAGTGAQQARAEPVAADRQSAIERRRAASVRSGAGETAEARRAFNERARGVADESEELLSMEAIAAPKPGAARPAPAPRHSPLAPNGSPAATPPPRQPRSRSRIGCDTCACASACSCRRRLRAAPAPAVALALADCAAPVRRTSACRCSATPSPRRLRSRSQRSRCSKARRPNSRCSWDCWVTIRRPRPRKRRRSWICWRQAKA